MRFDVLSLFPEILSGYLGQSLLKLAIERGLVDVRLHNIRDWAKDKHRTVDDRPYGGGPGMILKVEPVVDCVEAVRSQSSDGGHLVMLSPRGRRLTQPIVEELAGHKRLLLLCGRYEGFDDRVRQILDPEELSIGDYVLGGGEVPAMVVIDAVVRLVPGVLGDERSPRDDSFSGADRMLEFAQFTRPREFRGLGIPDVLLGGNHEEIARWRKEQSLKTTAERRSDLLPRLETRPASQ
ncbi:MAG TPA: tRNA (guanosine(37)-N1)-methyltransferase TrmD [Pirellulales bacterium]|jgi:tRNA (guanine37-N1)-methyltransferase|nr:tRNA (guanosine(37)-N1)-methyltransferase TrmD [Pirellulales bacterium]